MGRRSCQIEGVCGMTLDLADAAEAKGIKYFLISYTDLFGSQRAKLVPAAAIGGMQKTGAGFAGFASWLDMTPADPDIFARPDPDSLIQLPWKPEVGWLAADIWMDGEPVMASPRNALKAQIARASARGLTMKTGVECEFFLITPDGSAISDGADTQAKPCYDQQALMRRYDIITEICDSMLALGWQPYQNDHEDANGQFEMNWLYDEVLVTADRHAFFKFMTKSIAEKHGLRATFMPKPFGHLTGNGCHMHVSLWKGAANIFEDAASAVGLSSEGLAFIGGLIHSADALAAFCNPTVNSYRPGPHGVELLRDAHYNQLGRDRAPHAARQHDGRKHGPDLLDDGGGPRPRATARHQHVYRWAHAGRCEEAAAQPAGCAARAGRIRRAGQCARRAGASLSQAQACRVERLCPPPDGVGAVRHAGLLSAWVQTVAATLSSQSRKLPA